MTQSKPRSGPWELHPTEARVDAFVGGEAAPVCALLWPTDLRSEDETGANARLIAAAPELLAQLRIVTDDLEKVLRARGFRDDPKVLAARAIIAKATLGVAS